MQAVLVVAPTGYQTLPAIISAQVQLNARLRCDNHKVVHPYANYHIFSDLPNTEV